MDWYWRGWYCNYGNCVLQRAGRFLAAVFHLYFDSFYSWTEVRINALNNLFLHKPVISQGVEECFQVLFVLFCEVQRLAQYAVAIDTVWHSGMRVIVIVYYLPQCFKAAIVHIWCSHCYIAQTGHFHFAYISRIMCNEIAP